MMLPRENVVFRLAAICFGDFGSRVCAGPVLDATFEYLSVSDPVETDACTCEMW